MLCWAMYCIYCWPRKPIGILLRPYVKSQWLCLHLAWLGLVWPTTHNAALVMLLLLMLICGLRKSLRFVLWTSPFVFSRCHTFEMYLSIFGTFVKPHQRRRFWCLIFAQFQIVDNGTLYDNIMRILTTHICDQFVWFTLHWICQHKFINGFLRFKFDFFSFYS